jgi:hypothetical protein
VNEAALRDGLAALDSLALDEYRQSLVDVADDPDTHRSAVRVGRLVGVLLKEPFAVPQPLAQPSQRTSAYRAWQLLSKDDFEAASHAATQQYRALDQIRTELIPEEPHLNTLSTYNFAYLAQNENGFFGYFARAVRRYICGDEEIREKIEDALKESSKTGAKIPALTPEAIVGTGGLSLGVYLVQVVPLMGFVGAPIVAGILVILYKLGVEGFCEFSAHLRTDEEEKY